MALYSPNTRITGEQITAAKYMADHQLHADNQTPQLTEDYSSSVAQMQSTADPGEVGSESQATSLAGELERLRNVIKEITGEAQWYVTPDITLVTAALDSTTLQLLQWGII